jgi:addiction module RelE/StbE family toxin
MPPSLEWKLTARVDLLAIVAHIADDNPDAAESLKNEIEAKAVALLEHPKLYRPGRVKGTREMVIRPNYVVIYREGDSEISILRVLHTARQWP